MDDDRRAIARMIKETRSLPTLPTIVTRLNALSEKSDSTNREMAQIITSDQILAAKVLRLVNSPFYGFPRRVSTVSNALILLGSNVVKSLVLSTSIFEMMERSLLGLWEHSLATAAASNVIADHLRLPDKEEISTAGLLHDIGKIVIRVYLEEDPERLAVLEQEVEVPVFEVERELLGIDHSEVGRLLAKSWQLPDKLIEPIACHHDVAAATTWRQHTAVVHLADLLVKARGMGLRDTEVVPRMQAAARDALNLRNGDLETIIANLEDRLVEVRSFSLDIQQQESASTDAQNRAAGQ